MGKLKPCPFCGGEAEITKEDCYGFIDDEFLVICNICNLQFGFGSQYATKQEAIEAWNKKGK